MKQLKILKLKVVKKMQRIMMNLTLESDFVTEANRRHIIHAVVSL